MSKQRIKEGKEERRDNVRLMSYHRRDAVHRYFTIDYSPYQYSVIARRAIVNTVARCISA